MGNRSGSGKSSPKAKHEREEEYQRKWREYIDAVRAHKIIIQK